MELLTGCHAPEQADTAPTKRKGPLPVPRACHHNRILDRPPRLEFISRWKVPDLDEFSVRVHGYEVLLIRKEHRRRFPRGHQAGQLARQTSELQIPKLNDTIGPTS